MLTRSKDRKVTNRVNAGGNAAMLANSFGLPAGNQFSCPGATSFCERICYANKLETIYIGVRNVLLDNYNQLTGATYDEQLYLLSRMIREFSDECEKWNAPRKFRIHWDGDFYSLEYARAWREVIQYYPDIQFWVYTRSFTDKLNVLPELAGIPNLTVYLSADPVNAPLARERRLEGMFIATVADTFADAREAIGETEKTYACPENGKRIEMISKKGSACIRCGICVDGRGDVLFSKTKK